MFSIAWDNYASGCRFVTVTLLGCYSDNVFVCSIVRSAACLINSPIHQYYHRRRTTKHRNYMPIIEWKSGWICERVHTESNMVLDVLCLLLWRWIIPSCVLKLGFYSCQSRDLYIAGWISYCLHWLYSSWRLPSMDNGCYGPCCSGTICQPSFPILALAFQRHHSNLR